MSVTAGTNTLPPKRQSLSPVLQQDVRTGGHMQTMKTMALLHELQSHMISIERTAGEANQELEVLRKEKQVLEQELRKAKNVEPGFAKATLHFEYSQTMDLPPRVRALVEDNRVAKEQLRKSRTVHKEQERIIQMQMAHIDKYKEKLRDLREFKKSVEAEPVTRKQLEEAQRQLEERNRKIADLEKRIEVLELSSRVEVRGAKQAVATAKKEQAEAQAERDEIARELEERDRDLRAAKIQIKKLQGALLPLRMREHELRSREREVERLESLRAEVDFKLAKLDEPRVLLMMILVDDSGSKKKRSYKLASELTADEAVVIIQSYFRRMVARDRVQKMLHERAAVQIETLPNGELEAETSELPDRPGTAGDDPAPHETPEEVAGDDTEGPEEPRAEEVAEEAAGGREADGDAGPREPSMGLARAGGSRGASRGGDGERGLGTRVSSGSRLERQQSSMGSQKRTGGGFSAALGRGRGRAAEAGRGGGPGGGRGDLKSRIGKEDRDGKRESKGEGDGDGKGGGDGMVETTAVKPPSKITKRGR